MYTCRELENNNYMNQILLTKLKKKNKKIFKMQFIISIIIIIGISLYYFRENREKNNLEELSKILNRNMEFSKMYNIEKQKLEEPIYFGKIIIEKMDIDYPVFNEFNEDLLKIAPCKFYGGNIGESGNICIAGHNYNDNRFFSRLGEINLKDEVKIIDLNEKEYIYTVFDIFEIEETNVNRVLRKTKKKELTLLTCNNSNRKRLIVKAFLKENMNEDL